MKHIESESGHWPASEPKRFHIELDVTIDSPIDVWRAAFGRTIATTNLAPTTIIDAIGTSRDISLLDCLYLLASPAHYEGCEIVDFKVTPTLM